MLSNITSQCRKIMQLALPPLLLLGVETLHANTWLDVDENEGYTARHEMSFVQAGDRFYLFGGREQARRLETYNYTQDVWTDSAQAPLEFNHFQATEYEGHIWVIGAFRNNSFPQEAPAVNIYTYDPANNFWLEGRTIPQSRRRGSAGLVEYEGKFYVVGGNTIGHAGGFVRWFDVFDPETGTWTVLDDAPTARDHFHATVADNKLYVAGGRQSGGPGGVFAPLIATVDVYDFAAGTWSTLPNSSNLPTPRAGTSTVTFQGNVVVIGGEGNNQVYDTVEQLDPSTNNWTEIDSLNHARHGTQAVVSGNGIFTLGGSDRFGGGRQRNLEAFNSSVAVGTPNEAARLAFAQNTIVLPSTAPVAVELRHVDGNQGALITDVRLVGNDAGSFMLTAQTNLPNLVKANGSKSIMVRSNGNSFGRSAEIEVTYDNGRTVSIPVSTPSQGNGAPSGNLIQNGSFESVNVPGNFVVTDVIEGWTKNGDGFGEFWSSGFRGQPAQDGDVLMELDTGPVTRDVISQGVTTVVGQTYDLSVYLKARPNTTSDVNELVVAWNNQVQGRFFGGDAWTKVSVEVVGTGFDNVRLFEAGRSNTGLGTHIDNVSLVAQQSTADTNLSQGRNATQLTTAFNGPASLAVDGNTDGLYGNGSVTHTRPGFQAWWQVDLGAQSVVNSVVVHGRSDACCVNRLSNFYVLIDNQPFGNRSLDDLLNDASVESSFHSALSGTSVQAIFNQAQGRYVRIQLRDSGPLSLAEVQVIGSQ